MLAYHVVIISEIAKNAFRNTTAQPVHLGPTLVTTIIPAFFVPKASNIVPTAPILQYACCARAATTSWEDVQSCQGALGSNK